MATIQARKGKRGGVRYTATVRMRGHRSLSRTFSTKREAADWAADIEAAIRARRYNDPRLGQVPFGKAVEKYLAQVSVRKAVTTQQRERGAARVLVRELGHDTPMAEITPRVVAAYRDRRLRDVSAYTVRLELALLSHLYRVARREWEIPVDNPVANIDRPKEPTGRDVFLSVDEARRLLAECRRAKNPLLYPYVLLLLQSAMRPGEAASVRAWQIDIDRRSLILIDTKNGDRRPVPLTGPAVEALTPLVAGRRPEDFVFVRGRLPAIPNQVFREGFERARVRAGVPHVRMHDLRHTAASWLIMRGVDLRTLAAILGHRTLQMVLRYTHLDDAHLRAAIEKLGSVDLDTD